GGQVPEKKIKWPLRFFSTCLLHQLVLWKQLERHRVRPADQLIEKDLELATRAVDQIAGILRLLRRQLFEPAELTLEFVGVSGHRVKADHLDRARRLVNVRTGV